MTESHVTCFSETHHGVWANQKGKARLVYWRRRWNLKSWRQTSIKHIFCKINHLLIHSLNILAKLTVQGAKYILHTQTKKKKKTSRKMDWSPQFLKSQIKKWHSSLCLPSGTELHKSGNNSRDQMHLLPSHVFLARVVCFFDPVSFLHSLSPPCMVAC